MKWLLVVLIMILVAACTKDINMVLSDGEPKYVIEARISNLEPPYLVRITRTSNKAYAAGTTFLDDAEPVRNAKLYLSDDTGITDTLMPLKGSTVDPYWWYVYRNNRMDSIRSSFGSEWYSPARGYYQTTRIKGQAGHTYHLRVEVDSRIFEATAYMPPVPVMDSLSLKLTPVVPKGLEGYLPFIYFKEPQTEKNYYHVAFNSIMHYRYDVPDESYYGRGPFRGMVVDDELLAPYVNGLIVRPVIPGYNPYGVSYSGLDLHSSYQVRLSAITKETFEFFRVLIGQAEEDGNVYKPVPSSPVGNFSNGALGLFYATDISYRLILVNDQ